jgi:hypothetical protein
MSNKSFAIRLSAMERGGLHHPSPSVRMLPASRYLPKPRLFPLTESQPARYLYYGIWSRGIVAGLPQNGFQGDSPLGLGTPLPRGNSLTPSGYYRLTIAAWERMIELYAGIPQGMD